MLLFFRPWKTKLTAENWKSLLPYGLSLGVMNLTFYLALERIPLGIAVSLEFLGPLAVSLMGRRSKMDYLWSLLAGLGIYFIFPNKLGVGLDLIGVLWALAAALCWAIYIIYGSRSSKDISGGIAASLGMSIAALIVLPFGLFYSAKSFTQIDLLPLVIAVAFLSSALPYTLEMISLKNIPRQTFGILMSLEPACASLIGLLILKEDLIPTQWLAILLIVTASIGSSIKKRKGA